MLKKINKILAISLLAATTSYAGIVEETTPKNYVDLGVKGRVYEIQEQDILQIVKKTSFFYRVFDLYYDGFKHMTLGKTLWTVIIIKLIIMFLVLKVFFFPNFLKENSKPGKEGDFVEQQIMKR